MATAELKSIIFLNGKNFFIPTYQRGYRWEKTQVEELISDLYSFALSRPGDTQYYCLQPIVVKKRKDLMGDSWEVIDGQQRLTALWILNLAILAGNGMTLDNLNSYTLQYEKKNIFQNIIDIFATDAKKDASYNDYFSKIDSIEYSKTNCIDEIFFKNAVETVFSYKCAEDFTNNQRIQALRKTYVLADSIGDIISKDKVKIIWYEIDNDKEDAIETFINLNANKIELTNAELLKAKLFREAGDKRNELALKWEEIERGLHNNDFWSFIADDDYLSGKYKDATRIDYLFEIKLDNVNRNERHNVFRQISEILNAVSVKELWNDILNIYETLLDWYNDFYLYHTIGLLVHFKGIKVIKTLYSKYKNITKYDFKKFVLSQFEPIFTKDDYYKLFPELSRTAIFNSINDLTYEDGKKVRNLLLLYNVAILVNCGNKYERFPFGEYKKDTWNIEHIIPQKQTKEDKKVQNSSDDLTMLKSWIMNNLNISQSNLNSIISISELNQIISKEFPEDIDHIGNLTLLDEKTNKGYKNAPFADKREIVINILKNDIKSNKTVESRLILPGTKWVFLKGHLKSDIKNGTINYWRQEDCSSYINDICDRICDLFNINAEA